MPIDLYHSPVSPPCCAVRLVAAAIGVDLNLILVDLFTRENTKPEYAKINPHRTVPTLNDNGFYLYESRAICVYLVEKYAKDDSLFPKSPESRALINQRLYFDLGTLFESYNQYIYPQLIARKPADPAKLENCHKAMSLLNGFLQDKDYVAGDQVTVADFVLSISAIWYNAIDFDISKYKNVQRWIIKITAEVPKYDEIVPEGFKIYKQWVDSVLKKSKLS